MAELYLIEEGVIVPARDAGGAAPADARDLFSANHCRAVRAYLKRELGSEYCEVFRNAVLMPVLSRRAREAVDLIALVRVFDEVDLGSAAGRAARVYHVVDESDDAVGLVYTKKGEHVWFHR